MFTKEDLFKYKIKLQKYRGEVIDKSIDIEALVGAILSIYFTKESRQNEFNHKVLMDEYFSFGLKMRILEKIKLNLTKELTDKIRKINKIRDKFAHRIPGIIPKTGELSVTFELEEENPKKIEELYEEFMGLINEVHPELEKIFNNLINDTKE